MSDDRRIHVLVELRPTFGLAEVVTAATEGAAVGLPGEVRPELGPLAWDPSFAPVVLPSETAEAGFAGFGPASTLAEGSAVTYITRGEVSQEELSVLEERAAASEEVVGVYADELIQALPTCGGSAVVGDDADVERLVGVPQLQAAGMDGRDVLVAVVDTGFNRDYLADHGKAATFDEQRSWSVDSAVVPGQATVGHGTMCAWDALIAAPRCALADVALLRPGSFAGLLSDAIVAYRHLLDQIESGALFSQYRALVVNNSWGMFRPTWDFPVAHPGNYSDNPQHPFCRIVATLERYGADIVFAAGNCGYDCPDLRCGGVTTRTIYGANSHPAVLCVGGVDTDKRRVGYSSTGPGRLMNQKPDLSCYTHFAGSGVYPADSGTSAAAPVAAGVVAAVRSRFGYDPARPQTHPSSLRDHLIAQADRLDLASHSHEYGWGVVDGGTLAAADLPE